MKFDTESLVYTCVRADLMKAGAGAVGIVFQRSRSRDYQMDLRQW